MHQLHIKLAAARLLRQKERHRTRRLILYSVIVLASLGLTTGLRTTARQLDPIFDWLTWPIGLLWFLSLMATVVLLAIWCFVTIPQLIATQTAITHATIKLRTARQKSDLSSAQGALTIGTQVSQHGELSMDNHRGQLHMLSKP